MEEDLWHEQRGFRITENVSILRLNNVTPQGMLLRVRQVAQTCLKRYCGSSQNWTVPFRMLCQTLSEIGIAFSSFANLSRVGPPPFHPSGDLPGRRRRAGV